LEDIGEEGNMGEEGVVDDGVDEMEEVKGVEIGEEGEEMIQQSSSKGGVLSFINSIFFFF
jgi:hypothetical protein